MIRPYVSDDKIELVNLIKLNTPRYFNEAEEKDFIEYLDYYRESYFVYEKNSQIIGSGGINYFIDKGEARLSWDIVHPHFQGKGIGKKLTLHRIEMIKIEPRIKYIIVRTTQMVYPFYHKMGFKLENTEKDFWAKGFDLYLMKMQLKD